MLTVNFSLGVNIKKAVQILDEISNDSMGGFLDLPTKKDSKEIAKIKKVAAKINEDSEVLVCIGIGGSYLGHRAIIEALGLESKTKIVYAGNSLSKRELMRALDEVGDSDFSINIISKSGTTLEPSVAFSEFKKKLVEKYGEEEAKKRIYATTDANKGTLHDEAVENGYTMFVVPDNVGGRYSVLSAVSLLPLAVAGIDIDELLASAEEERSKLMAELDGCRNEDSKLIKEFTQNPIVKYAFMRHELGLKGYDTEVFASFEPSTMYFNEWLKQLFGESEGKNRQGVWPASVIYSTDLHSLGQFMQDGRRNLWETIIDYPTDEMNAKVVSAVKTAHTAGGIPVLAIEVPSFDEKGFGELIYFFEVACAMSAKLFGVNPFDQPGVEAYKGELKKLLQ